MCHCSKQSCCCEEEDEDEVDIADTAMENWGLSGNQWLRYAKITTFFIVWLVFTVSFRFMQKIMNLFVL